MTFKRLTVVTVLFTASALTLRGAPAAHHAHLSDDLLRHVARHATERARVIVQGDQTTVDDIAARHHLQIVRRMAHSAVFVANSDEMAELAADAAVDNLSGDVLVKNWMSVSNKSTAADQTRAGYAGGLFGLGSIAPVSGKNIGVAVIDSGISAHPALGQKIAFSKSFVTGDPNTNDVYGHGTHIAGIIAGSPTSVTPLYTGGIAPDARLINLRVLGNDGTGLTSDVIDGIEWAVNNRQAWNIRVINLSLGHPVMEPSTTDPLCLAVADAVNNGIVVVAAAGNTGKSPDGHMVLGSIASPGNSPLALTVGALNTWGTVGRADDSVTTYSSRGPTRFEFIVKPDVAAPGNKIVSLQANGSFLATMYPTLHVAGSPSNAYMMLSGTSMAAPMVSGGIALLLQGTPGLSPAQVKLAMQTSATYVKDGGLMGAGAGSVNFWAARKTANSGLIGSLLNTVVGGLGVTSSGAAFWDAGTLSKRLYDGVGIRLLSALEAPLVWLNPSLLHVGDLNLVGLLNPLASIGPKWLQYGVIGDWTNSQSIMWGDTIYDPQGNSIMWGDSDFSDGSSIMWGDSIDSSDPK